MKSRPVLRWVPDSRALLYGLYVRSEGDVSNIWSQPIDGGKPTQVTNFNNDQIDTFDLSRDGSRLVLDRSRTNSDVIRDVSRNTGLISECGGYEFA